MPTLRQRLRSMPLWVRLLAFPLVILVVLPVIAVAVILICHPDIELLSVDDELEEMTSFEFGRPVAIDGEVHLILGLRPVLEIYDLRLGNPDGWEGNFATVKRIRAQLDLLSLIQHEIIIDEISLEGLRVELKKDAKGSPNWEFASLGKSENKIAANTEWKLVEVKDFSVTDLVVLAWNTPEAEPHQLHLQSLKGLAEFDEPLQVVIRGEFLDLPFDGQLVGGSLTDLTHIDGKWPFSLKGRFGSASASLDGVLSERRFLNPEELRFKIDAPDLSLLEDFTGPLLGYQSAHLEGEIELSHQRIQLSNLSGQLGDTTLQGDLNFNTSSKKPHIEGTLKLGVIDGEKLLRTDQSEPSNSDNNSDATPSKLEANLSDQFTLPFTGNLSLFIEEIDNPKVDALDINFKVEISERTIDTSISLDIAGAKLTGDLGIQINDQGVAMVVGKVHGTNGDIVELSKIYTDSSSYSGTFESIRVSLQSEGRHLQEIWRQRKGRLTVTDARISYQTEDEPIAFTIDQGVATRSSGQATVIEASGLYHDRPIDLKLVYLERHRLLAGQKPFIEITGKTGGADFNLRADLSVSADVRHSDYQLKVKGPRIGALKDWLPINPNAEFPFEVTAHLIHSENELRLTDIDARIGTTHLTGALDLNGQAQEGIPQVTAVIEEARFEEWAELFAPDDPPKKQNTEGIGDKAQAGEKAAALDPDEPLLPAEFSFPDLDLDLKLGHFRLRDSDWKDFSITAKMREGQLLAAPFSVKVDNSPLKGSFTADFRASQPQLGIRVKGEQINIGVLMSQLKLMNDLELFIGSFEFDCEASGRTLRQLVSSMTYTATQKKTLWTLTDSNTKAKQVVTIPRLTLSALPDLRMGFEGEAQINDDIFQLSGSNNFREIVLNPKVPLSLLLKGEFSNTEVLIDGSGRLPLTKEGFGTQVTIKGRRLDAINRFFNLDFPPIGPYSLTSNLHVVPEGYGLQDAVLEIGSSRITGGFRIVTSGKKPRIEAELHANPLQIDDFYVEGWSPRTNEEPQKERPAGERSAEERLREIRDPLGEMFSEQVLSGFDGKLDIQIDSLLSGTDKVGGGHITASIENGRIAIEPLIIELPGGKFSGSYSYHPRGKVADWHLKLKTSHLDYGILARRAFADSEMAGHLDLDLDLRTKDDPIEDSLLGGSNGYINFDICPEKMDAGIYDLWATNLLLALLPKLDARKKSKLNCVIGRMKVSEGVATPESLGIDSTKVRVAIDGTVNFKTNTLDLTLKPYPKRAQLLSLEMPLSIDGSFDQPRIHMGKFRPTRTLLRMTKNTVLFPLKTLSNSKIPADGSDICKCSE